ncbi:cytidylyltransferase domain-containing protein [Aeromicrobium sp. CF4.19]|uniref:cytidylyltransferase domain-containing protein n=1 Tax=Aeromicrobium sp. CF4.19 TaxID=3373082 RepID=UPI003EE488B1
MTPHHATTPARTPTTAVRARPEAPVADVCVIIPARGGSKGVPRKNLRLLGGEPLVARAVRTVLGAPGVDGVVVSTDDAEIAFAARTAGARVVDRPERLAGDLASSESAIQHALGRLAHHGPVPTVIVLVQATSPFIDPGALGRAISAVRAGECDVAFSVTRSHGHLWRHGADGPEGVNHDVGRRQRRQDREPQMEETGAFYVMRTDGFLEHGHRFFGRLRMVEVDARDALEIDSEHDLRLAEELLLRREAEGTDTAAAPIAARAVVTDFDGVHTDDSVRVDSAGVESVIVSRSDGMGVARLRRSGRPVLVLSTETNPVVDARANKLGVQAITGCSDKLTALREWACEHDVGLHDIAYLGNDVNDVECLAAVGWPVVPADAHPACRVLARHVLRRPGGQGAVRELADRVLSPEQDLTTQEGSDHG